MESKNKDWFKYNRYWRQWSRVLCRAGGNFDNEISIPITPVNDIEVEWGEIEKVLIKRFDNRFSATKSDNQYTHVLPDVVYKDICEHVGNSKADVLIHSDILPLIDWEKHQHLGDTYVPFKLCAIEQQGFFNRVHHGDGDNCESFLTAEQFKTTYDIHVPENHILVGGIYHQHGKQHVRCYGWHDLGNNTISFEALLDGDDYSVLTRFSGRVGGELGWDKSMLTFFQSSPYVNIETFDAILQMTAKTIRNLAVYKKD